MNTNKRLRSNPEVTNGHTKKPKRVLLEADIDHESSSDSTSWEEAKEHKSVAVCDGCGRKHPGINSQCEFKLKKHPNFNNDFVTAWKDSFWGKKWRQKFGRKDKCPNAKAIDIDGNIMDIEPIMKAREAVTRPEEPEIETLGTEGANTQTEQPHVDMSRTGMRGVVNPRNHHRPMQLVVEPSVKVKGANKQTEEPKIKSLRTENRRDIDAHKYHCPMTILHTHNNDYDIECMALLDNGAFGHQDTNYISYEVRDLIAKAQSERKVPMRSNLKNNNRVFSNDSLKFNVIQKHPKISLRGAFKSDVPDGTHHEHVRLLLTFKNEITRENESIDITCNVADIRHDIILGRGTIGRFNLTEKLPSQFRENNEESEEPVLYWNKRREDDGPLGRGGVGGHLRETVWAAHSPSDEVLEEEIGESREESTTHQKPDQASAREEGCQQHTDKGGLHEVETIEDVHLKTPVHQARRVRLQTQIDLLKAARDKEAAEWAENLCVIKQAYPELKWDKHEDDLKDLLSAQEGSTDSTCFIPREIHGSESGRKLLEEVCRKHKKVFSTVLAQHPASVAPMELVVDEKKWRSGKSRQPPRPQSLLKQEALRKDVMDYKSAGVIRDSQEAHCSQVHLVPKKDPQDLRTCIDFRFLNDCTESNHWPIPNIKAMLQRIASKKAKYYAVLDLTKGYHQIALAEGSRRYTAFTTFMGTYEWNRVPMGLKGAASYFQQKMASDVLGGLIYAICELYIDDLIIYAETEEELAERLDKVLERLEQFNVKVNPNKAKIGLTEIEYVGQLLSADGISFSEAKRREVSDFQKPKTNGDLKSFLGLANYFREHVENHSIITQPLQNMVKHYKSKADKHKVVRWTEEGEKAFNDIKESILNCPTLHHLEEGLPVILCTDACDYGIGAYLYQMKDDKERPIAYISKSLAKEQLRWSTPEKEMYAIFYALRKFEHHLRDIHFTLKTDHKNLTIMDADTNAKVLRWKLMLQEFDYEIEHIKGEDNVIADGFSRICASEEHRKEERMESINALEDYKLTDNMYKFISHIGHNTLIGHGGVERTYDKMLRACISNPEIPAQWYKGEVNWNTLKSDIRKFIRQCPVCQKLNPLKPRIHANPFTLSSGHPMDRLAIDLIGPLPKDEEGNEFIVVIIDCFSRFVELYPVKDSLALSAAKVLLQHFGRYGAPRELCSDNGPQFVSAIIQDLIRLVGTKHTLTLAYSHEENGLVERANKEIMRDLKAIVYDKRLEVAWSIILPLIQRMMNTEVHKSIGVAPAMLVYGGMINLDRGLFLPHSTLTDTRVQDLAQENSNKRRKKAMAATSVLKVSQYMDKLLSLQQRVLLIAQKTQKDRNLFHIQKRLMQRGGERVTEYPIGSYVLVEPAEGEVITQAHTKIHTKLKGPFRVMKISNDQKGYRYHLMNLATGKLEPYHVSSLRAFVFDPAQVDPDVAKADILEYTIEEVLSHTGTFDRVSEMKFKVRRAGFEKTIVEMDWKDIRLNTVFHEYLRRKGFAHKIPQET